MTRSRDDASHSHHTPHLRTDTSPRPPVPTHATHADPRAQLLADLPVAERRIDVAGVPTVPRADRERISVPTTLIWGRDDRAVGVGVAETARERYGWPLHIVDDAGDDPKLERPDAFLAALDHAMDAPTPSGPTA